MLLDSQFWSGNLHIDQNVYSDQQINTFYLSRLRHTINFSQLEKLFYNALILPIFWLWWILYMETAQFLNTQLYYKKLQNRACRIILGVSPYSPHAGQRAPRSFRLEVVRNLGVVCHFEIQWFFKALNDLATSLIWKGVFQFLSKEIYSLRSNGKFIITKSLGQDYCKTKNFSYRGIYAI